jgi:hypothetical protein
MASVIRSLGLVAGLTLAAGLAHAQTTTPTEPTAPVPQATAPVTEEGDAQNGRQRLRSTLPP